MSNINEQELRNYLLGSLTPERRAELGTLVQADESLREELFAIEEELVEQYLAGGLNAEETESFERHILTTERGQQQLRFAQLFERYRNSNPVDDPLPVHRVPAPNIPPNETSSPLFPPFYRHPTFSVLAIVMAGLVISLGGWLLVPPFRAPSVAEQRSHEVEVPLVPDSTRSKGNVQRVTAPAGNSQVKLMLELTKSDYKKYKMQLFRENQTLASQEELQTESRVTYFVIPVTVTAEILTPGNYELKLTGVLDSGQQSFVDSYPFLVTTPKLSEDEQRDDFAR